MRRVLARLRKATAALIIAVLVIVPVADAFACSFEIDVGHAASATEADARPSADEKERDGLPDGSHDMCVHNHCHHPSANIFFLTSASYDPAAIVPSAFQAPAPASEVYEGLIRPPRS